MNTWTVIGTGSLGVVIGWLVWVFVQRTSTFPLKALSAAVAIVGGGATLALWRTATKTALPDEANCYFIGIVAAVVVLGALKGAAALLKGEIGQRAVADVLGRHDQAGGAG